LPQFQLKDKVSEEDKKTLVDKCDEISSWLERKPTAEKHEYDGRLKELDSVIAPIISKAYASSGGAGMPGMGGDGQQHFGGDNGGSASGGPTVEEEGD
jgi:L1 cell adhesion molecule like protein